MPWLPWKCNSIKIYEDCGTGRCSPFCFCKNDSSVPDFCHLDALVILKQTAPKSEKLRWVNNGCKFNQQSGLWETQAPWQTPFFIFHSFIYHSAFKLDFTELTVLVSMCSCCMYAFPDGWNLPFLQGWCPHSGKEIVRKYVCH